MLRFQYFHERASYQTKFETCKFNGRKIIHEAEKTLKTCHGRIKNKDGNKISKSQSHNHGRRGAEIWRDDKKSGIFRYIINLLRNCNFIKRSKLLA